MASKTAVQQQRDEAVARQPDGLPDPDLATNAQIVLEKRYLRRSGDRVLETPGGGFWRVAEEVARGSAPHESDEVTARLRREYYLAMARLDFLPNSPTLMNAGKKNGLQYSACYVLPVPDSMDDIFETNKRAALIHQSGGGTGFAFSRLRPAGDVVGSTGGVASGPVSFLEVYNASTESVKQGGTRRGANMGILRVDHPDILRFIDCKRELNERSRPAYDAVAPYLGSEQQIALKKALLEGQIANFNISVGVTDPFMQALARGEDYDLVNPRTGEVTGTLNAQEVWKQMVQNAWETGDPGVVFLDRINAGAANPVPEMGPVEATNPCGEQPLYPNEACNLGSINLAKFVRPLPGRKSVANGAAEANGLDGANGHKPHNGHANGHSGFSRHPAIDWERLGKMVRLSIRFLDDVISVNPYPDAAIDEAVKANRRVGLGVMGWADLLMMLEIPYDSQAALDLGEEIMRFINDTAHDESCTLGEARGPFPSWERSIYRKGRKQRNSTVTTIAPTGTISIIAGCSSGIEPIFALVFDRKGSLDGLMHLEVNSYFTEVAKSEGFWSEELAEQVHRHGTVRGLDAVPQHWQGIFGTSHDIAPEWHVRMQAAFQRHTDNAVSKTINLPHDATVEDVDKAYRTSYELGCNGITVYRDGSKLGVLHAGNAGGAAPAAAAQSVPIDRVKPRPRLLQGLTFQQETPLGTAYITINADEQDQPYEVFVNQGKTGSDVAAMSVAIGKLASLVLGLPSAMSPTERLTEVARRLRGIGGSTSWGFGPDRARSLPDALAQVVETYLGRHQPSSEDAEKPASAGPVPSAQLALPTVATGEFCPDCSNGLVFEEGCSKCPHCGFSKC